MEFVPIAISKGLSMPYKTTNWDKIPGWARDNDGQWALSYTGTIAFLISKDVKNPPKTFSDLLNGDYKVSIGEVGKATQSNIGVLAAAYALGGNETNLKPAIDLYAKLAEQKRLLPINVFPANMEKGEVQVAILWDFNALAYRDIAGKDKWDVLIPADGSATGGYTTTINAYSLRPNIAKLVREYAFSGRGARSPSPVAMRGRSHRPAHFAARRGREEIHLRRSCEGEADRHPGLDGRCPTLIKKWQEDVASRM